MAKEKSHSEGVAQSKATARQEQQEQRDAEARGESKDVVVLTNDSGEVKRLRPDEFDVQKDVLMMEGWKVLGQDDGASNKD